MKVERWEIKKLLFSSCAVVEVVEVVVVVEVGAVGKEQVENISLTSAQEAKRV